MYLELHNCLIWTTLELKIKRHKTVKQKFLKMEALRFPRTGISPPVCTISLVCQNHITLTDHWFEKLQLSDN